jgi:hypothetical protein
LCAHQKALDLLGFLESLKNLIGNSIRNKARNAQRDTWTFRGLGSRAVQPPTSPTDPTTVIADPAIRRDGACPIRTTTTTENEKMNFMQDPAAFADWFARAYGEPPPDELPDQRERLLHLEGYYRGLCRLSRRGGGYAVFDECSGEWLTFADLDAFEREIEARSNQ